MTVKQKTEAWLLAAAADAGPLCLDVPDADGAPCGQPVRIAVRDLVVRDVPTQRQMIVGIRCELLDRMMIRGVGGRPGVPDTLIVLAPPGHVFYRWLDGLEVPLASVIDDPSSYSHLPRSFDIRLHFKMDDADMVLALATCPASRPPR